MTKNPLIAMPLLVTSKKQPKVPPPANKDWVKSAGWAKEAALYEAAARLGTEYRSSMTWEKEHAGS